MANADVLLARLEGVQKSGTGWRTRCPACGGRSRKVSVSESDDGRVLLHCFGGCEALAVLHAVGLQLTDLFPERIRDDSPDGRQQRRIAAREAQWAAALEVLEFEARIAALAARDVLAGKPAHPEDLERVELALQRIEDARSIFRPQAPFRPGQVAA